MRLADGTVLSQTLLRPCGKASRDQCTNGAWRVIGSFKNQGDCVSFVATGGKNPPAKSP